MTIYHKLFVIHSKFNSTKSCKNAASSIKWRESNSNGYISHHVLAAFQCDNLFTLCLHAGHNTVELLGQVVLQLLITRVFDLPSQIFTVTNAQIKQEITYLYTHEKQQTTQQSSIWHKHINQIRK